MVYTVALQKTPDELRGTNAYKAGSAAGKVFWVVLIIALLGTQASQRRGFYITGRIVIGILGTLFLVGFVGGCLRSKELRRGRAAVRASARAEAAAPIPAATPAPAPAATPAPAPDPELGQLIAEAQRRYADLDQRRRTLNAKDKKAVAAFNKDAAEYEKVNKAMAERAKTLTAAPGPAAR